MLTNLISYLGLGFNIFLIVLSVGAYYYVLNKTGKKWYFFVVLAMSWAVFAVSYILLLNDAGGDWAVAILRIIGYVLSAATLFTAIAELTKLKVESKNKTLPG